MTLSPPTRSPKRTITFRTVPISPIPTALDEYMDRVKDWERTAPARAMAEFIDSGELPLIDPSAGFHTVYGYAKIESAIDYMRRELYRQRLMRPVVWMTRAPHIRWWKEALAEWKPIPFFAGQKAQRFRSHMVRWNRAPAVRMAVAHVNVLTSPNVFECSFTRTFEIVFFDYPFHAGMVRQAIDLTLRDTSFPRIYVDFLCLRDTLDHKATEIMRRDVAAMYASHQ